MNERTNEQKEKESKRIHRVHLTQSSDAIERGSSSILSPRLAGKPGRMHGRKRAKQQLGLVLASRDVFSARRKRPRRGGLARGADPFQQPLQKSE